MKIVQVGIWVLICVVLNGCSGLLPDQNVGECYSVDNLDPRQRVDLNVGSGNPILLIGNEKIVCSCYQPGSLAGVGEKESLAGAGEEGSLAGIGEKESLAGAGEEGSLAGVGEKESLAGAGEEGSLAGIGEKESLVGAGEEGSLVGIGEKEHLAGAVTEFSCRIVPECPGFKLVGYYGQDQIKIRTGTQQKFVSTDCITW
ncbi:MAG: hypothetical protein D3908_00300 [Candidatus Electrothrix sp. AUS4]|nr:hypothetical protein [Candidatus Electrothrix sp. AUS4]